MDRRGPKYKWYLFEIYVYGIPRTVELQITALRMRTDRPYPNYQSVTLLYIEFGPFLGNCYKWTSHLSKIINGPFDDTPLHWTLAYSEVSVFWKRDDFQNLINEHEFTSPH